MPVIEKIHAEPGATFGARRITHALRRRGNQLVRCTVEQMMARAVGHLLRASPALPGAVHDIKAARTHGIIDALDKAGMQWAFANLIMCWRSRGSGLRR